MKTSLDITILSELISVVCIVRVNRQTGGAHHVADVHLGKKAQDLNVS